MYGMKVGLSFSRCVRDIVEGIVDPDDVLVVIGRTDLDPRDDAQWSAVWAAYAGGNYANTAMEWSGTEYTEQQYRSVSIDLWEQGKLHQPRKFGAHPRRLRYHWLEAVLPDSELERYPAVRDAWQQFQSVAALTNVKLNSDIG